MNTLALIPGKVKAIILLLIICLPVPACIRHTAAQNTQAPAICLQQAPDTILKTHMIQNNVAMVTPDCCTTAVAEAAREYKALIIKPTHNLQAVPHLYTKELYHGGDHGHHNHHHEHCHEEHVLHITFPAVLRIAIMMMVLVLIL